MGLGRSALGSGRQEEEEQEQEPSLAEQVRPSSPPRRLSDEMRRPDVVSFTASTPARRRPSLDEEPAANLLGGLSTPTQASPSGMMASPGFAAGGTPVREFAEQQREYVAVGSAPFMSPGATLDMRASAELLPLEHRTLGPAQPPDSPAVTASNMATAAAPPRQVPRPAAAASTIQAAAAAAGSGDGVAGASSRRHSAAGADVSQAAAAVPTAKVKADALMQSHVSRSNSFNKPARSTGTPSRSHSSGSHQSLQQHQQQQEQQPNWDSAVSEALRKAQATLAQLAEKLAATEADKAALQEEVAALRAAARPVNAVDAENAAESRKAAADQVEAQLRSRDAKIALLDKDAAAKGHQIRQLQEQLGKEQAAVESLRQELLEARDERVALEKAGKEAGKKVEAAGEKERKASAEAAAAHNEAQALAAQLARLQEELAAARDRALAAEARAGAAEARAGAAEARLGAAEGKAGAADSKVMELMSRAARATAGQEELLAQLTSVTDRADAAEARSRQLAAQLHAAQAANASLQQAAGVSASSAAAPDPAYFPPSSYPQGPAAPQPRSVAPTAQRAAADAPFAAVAPRYGSSYAPTQPEAVPPYSYAPPSAAAAPPLPRASVPAPTVAAAGNRNAARGSGPPFALHDGIPADPPRRSTMPDVRQSAPEPLNAAAAAPLGAPTQPQHAMAGFSRGSYSEGGVRLSDGGGSSHGDPYPAPQRASNAAYQHSTAAAAGWAQAAAQQPLPGDAGGSARTSASGTAAPNNAYSSAAPAMPAAAAPLAGESEVARWRRQLREEGARLAGAVGPAPDNMPTWDQHKAVMGPAGPQAGPPAASNAHAGGNAQQHSAAMPLQASPFGLPPADTGAKAASKHQPQGQPPARLPSVPDNYSPAHRPPATAAAPTKVTAAAPFANEQTMQDLLAQSKHMEDTLLVLGQEKASLEAEYAKLPANAGRTLQERSRKASVEKRMEVLSKEISNLRLALKRLYLR